MGRPNTSRSTLLTAGIFSAAAAGLFAAPPSVQQAIRAGILDVVITGQSVAMNHYDNFRATSLRWPTRLLSGNVEFETNSENDRLVTLEQTCRSLRIENARLHEELQLAEKYGVSPVPVSAVTKASLPTVVRAAVVSRETLSHWRSVRSLNRGRAAGITESSLVLEEGQPHLDQGSDAGVEPELDVFIGRCVVGRVASVGRWTSTLESITDPRYRALVQIVRPTDQGGSFGTEGILVGQGNGLCNLTEVPTTETVRVGDEVYTSERDGRAGVPLYYGRIRTVEEAGRHWDISVEPAVKTADLKSVDVLKLPPSFARPLAE
jgi:cell shape-determining protein MreC